MLIAMLFAVAAPLAAPVPAALVPAAIIVAPADVTALFKGDGTAVKFDPACKNFTLESVSSDPACAARVAKGEAAPSLAIAIRTMVETPARSADAIALLQRSIAFDDRPATHYLLGSVIGTAERLAPDYARASKHLGIAAARGNPAAADLLASLLIDGKGGRRDVPRAIALYEMAAANGFPSSAIKLALLYLKGRHVPKDEARGRAWLVAAASVNVPSASQILTLVEMDAKVSNFQLIPSPLPAKIRAVRFGNFDNPEIPPNFGFDPDFHAVHTAPYSDEATLARLEMTAKAMPTPYLYELARRLAGRDPQRSLRTYFLARTRMLYDANRCGDPAAIEAVTAWDRLILPDIRFLVSGAAPGAATVAAVLAEEAAMPAGDDPWWVCRSGMVEMAAAMEGKSGPLNLRPRADWPALRAAALKPIMSIKGAR